MILAPTTYCFSLATQPKLELWIKAICIYANVSFIEILVVKFYYSIEWAVLLSLSLLWKSNELFLSLIFYQSSKPELNFFIDDINVARWF